MVFLFHSAIDSSVICNCGTFWLYWLVFSSKMTMQNNPDFGGILVVYKTLVIGDNFNLALFAIWSFSHTIFSEFQFSFHNLLSVHSYWQNFCGAPHFVINVIFVPNHSYSNLAKIWIFMENSAYVRRQQKFQFKICVIVPKVLLSKFELSFISLFSYFRWTTMFENISLCLGKNRNVA